MLPIIKKQSQVTKKSSALTRATERFKARQRTVRIGFIVDATGSRTEGWEQAQAVQGQMFRSVSGLGRVSLRLIHYGADTLTDLGWSTDTRAIAKSMAAVRCQRGLTQILPALRAFLSDVDKADSVILVGDAFEECAAEAETIARRFKAAGIKIFTFFEGYDTTTEHTFQRLAAITGGSCARLGVDLPLGDLCTGVALLTAGGEKAVKRLKNKKARQLLLTGPSAK